MEIPEFSPLRERPVHADELLMHELEKSQLADSIRSVGDDDFGADPYTLESLRDMHRQRFGSPMLHGGMRGVMDLAPYLATAYALSQGAQ